jgi:lipoyl(octanoyl) transferase
MTSVTWPRVEWLGRVGYEEGLRFQEEAVEARRNHSISDTLFLLEHPPVYTLGRTGVLSNLLLPREELARDGIEVYEIDRGGDITFHGPGQLVGYPIVDLRCRAKDAHRFLRDLEQVIINALATFGVDAGRIPGLTGVWVGDAKVCAMGIGVRRWITKHGFALNVNCDLSYFDRIVPCGIRDKGVTSMKELLGREIDLVSVRQAVGREFFNVMAGEEREGVHYGC